MKPNEDAKARKKRLKGLIELNARHRESRILAAEQALEDWDLAAAQAALDEVREADGDASARVCGLFAQVAEARGDNDEARMWANRAAQAWLSARGASLSSMEARAVTVRQSGRNPGDAVVAARRHAGLSARELSLRTRIGLRYLLAIEQFDVADLPRAVYLRGYLREIARALEIDAPSLVQDYLTALAEARTGKILSKPD